MLLAQVEMAAADKVEMFVALMNFTGSVLPNIVDNVNQVGISSMCAPCSIHWHLSGHSSCTLLTYSLRPDPILWARP